MNISLQRRFLVALTGVLLVGSALAVVWSLSEVPLSSGELVAGIDKSSVPDDDIEPTPPSETLDDRSAALSLRGPLYDPPPAEPKPKPTPPPVTRTAPPPKPQLELTLVGTIIQGDGSLAIVADASGKFDVKGVGESLELSPAGVQLQSIESEQVTLDYLGRSTTISLDRANTKTNGGNKPEGNRKRNAR